MSKKSKKMAIRGLREPITVTVFTEKRKNL